MKVDVMLKPIVVGFLTLIVILFFVVPDASGTYVGTSYLWMSPRDHARFGLLYLQDGVWDGERILPEGWVAYSSAPTPAAPNGIYGAQFWRNGYYSYQFPDIPDDAYLANGYEGQRIMIIPSKELVVVRLGYTATDDFDMNTLVGDVIRALEWYPKTFISV